MEWNINFNFIKKLNDELQIAVAENTKAGEKISRETLDEQPHFDKLEYHPSNSKVFKRLNLYHLVKGKIKLGWEWQESDNINQNDIDFITTIYSEHREDEGGVYEHEDNSMYITSDKVDTNVWSKPSMEWELKTSGSSMEIMEDDTKIFCALSNDYGWKSKIIDLLPTATVETTKLGDKCYLWSEKGCEINGVERTGTNIIKKLESENCTIKNTSDEILHLIMVYK